MNIEYTLNMRKESQSSVDIVIPELDTIIGKWRKSTVDIASLGVPSHITLLWPWCPPPISDEYIKKLENVLSFLNSFVITFHKIEYFGESVIYLDVENKKEVKELMDRVGQEFPEYPMYENTIKDPQSHLTIAKPKNSESFFKVNSEIKQYIAPLLPLKFNIEEITIMEQKPDQTWIILKSISLIQ